MGKFYVVLIVFSVSGCVLIPRSNSQDVSMQQNRFHGKVKLGMAREQVMEKWGTPDKIVQKRGKNFDEIWIYIPHWKLKNYLYFKDGILVDGLRE